MAVATYGLAVDRMTTKRLWSYAFAICDRIAENAYAGQRAVDRRRDSLELNRVLCELHARGGASTTHTLF